uniref:Uncharacterized protein n=1 Tax=Rhipicephalus microplus TaxID=6941 RepID=A0A6M2DAB6_RHIMP
MSHVTLIRICKSIVSLKEVEGGSLNKECIFMCNLVMGTGYYGLKLLDILSKVNSWSLILLKFSCVHFNQGIIHSSRLRNFSRLLRKSSGMCSLRADVAIKAFTCANSSRLLDGFVNWEGFDRLQSASKIELRSLVLETCWSTVDDIHVVNIQIHRLDIGKETLAVNRPSLVLLLQMFLHTNVCEKFNDKYDSCVVVDEVCSILASLACINTFVSFILQ